MPIGKKEPEHEPFFSGEKLQSGLDFAEFGI